MMIFIKTYISQNIVNINWNKYKNWRLTELNHKYAQYLSIKYDDIKFI